MASELQQHRATMSGVRRDPAGGYMLRYRKSLGWTREQLARALVGWVDVETLTALETGEPTLMAQSETWDLVERVWQLLRAQPYIHLAEGQQSDAVRFRAAIDQAASVLDDVRS